MSSFSPFLFFPKQCKNLSITFILRNNNKQKIPTTLNSSQVRITEKTPDLPKLRVNLISYFFSSPKQHKDLLLKDSRAFADSVSRKTLHQDSEAGLLYTLQDSVLYCRGLPVLEPVLGMQHATSLLRACQVQALFGFYLMT